LTGTIRAMDFEMDLKGTGAVKQLRGETLSAPVPRLKLKFDGEHFLFDFKEDDDPDSTHWRSDFRDSSHLTIATEGWKPASLRAMPPQSNIMSSRLRKRWEQ
jgi:hypothetical protein